MRTNFLSENLKRLRINISLIELVLELKRSEAQDRPSHWLLTEFLRDFTEQIPE